MRVLITGAHGQVGRELMNHAPAGFQLAALGSGELDISNATKVATAVKAYRPQLIMNAAAYTAVDKAESDPEAAYAVNRDGVANLAKAAELAGIPLMHISTDYVFSGEQQAPYRETDSTDPKSVYGASKLAGEESLIKHCGRYLILRTSWVFGASGHNFVKTMLRLSAEREELKVVADQVGGPTSAASIASTLWQLAERYRDQKQLLWGIYHYSGAPACSWHDFAAEIFVQAKRYGLLSHAPQLKAITTAEYPTPARRPSNSVLDCDKFYRTYGIGQPDWKADLARMLELKELKI